MDGLTKGTNGRAEKVNENRMKGKIKFGHRYFCALKILTYDKERPCLSSTNQISNLNEEGHSIPHMLHLEQSVRYLLLSVEVSRHVSLSSRTLDKTNTGLCVVKGIEIMKTSLRDLP